MEMAMDRSFTNGLWSAQWRGFGRNAFAALCHTSYSGLHMHIKVGDEAVDHMIDYWNGRYEIRSRDVGGTGSSVLSSRGMYVRKGWRERRRRRVIRVVCFDATRVTKLIHSDLPFIDG